MKATSHITKGAPEEIAKVGLATTSWRQDQLS